MIINILKSRFNSRLIVLDALRQVDCDILVDRSLNDSKFEVNGKSVYILQRERDISNVIHNLEGQNVDFIIIIDNDKALPDEFSYEVICPGSVDEMINNLIVYLSEAQVDEDFNNDGSIIYI